MKLRINGIKIKSLRTFIAFLWTLNKELMNAKWHFVVAKWHFTKNEMAFHRNEMPFRIPKIRIKVRKILVLRSSKPYLIFIM